jgi:methionyl-tRNA formyltransferase
MNKINIALFFNNQRGLKVVEYFSKKNQKKKFNINILFISKKNQYKKLLKSLKNYGKFLKVVISNPNSKFVENKLKQHNIELNLICGFPYILKKNIFSLPKYGTINLHGGPLPKYRGGSPLNWQIINNEKYIGISSIKVDRGIDTGPIILQKKFKLKITDDISDVHKKANHYFPFLAKQSIYKLINNKKLTIQNKSKKNYFKQRSSKDGKIIWNKMTNLQIFNLVRAVTNPYPGAFCYNNNKEKIIIYKCKAINAKLQHTQPGNVMYKNKYPEIRCKKGSVRIIKSSKKLFK